MAQTGSDGNSIISSLIKGVDYASSNNIVILNCSIGWYQIYSLNDPFKIIISNYPGLFICSAGNASQNNDVHDHYPSNFNLSNIIVVGASTYDNDRWYFSNYGTNTVDLFAPGANIYSTIPNDDYAYDSGTSMATPCVTGVAALIKSIRPDFTPAQIKRCIMSTVDKYSNTTSYCVSGGVLNAYKALRYATEQQTFIGDVDGDGYNDMIMSGKNSSNKRVLTTILGTSTGNFNTEYSFASNRNFVYGDLAYSGDFNGDGRTDILIMWNNGSYRQLLLYLGNSSGTFNEGVNLSSSRFHDSYQFPYKAFVMDVNNDGKDDFVIVFKNSFGKRGFLVYKGTNTSPYIIDATTNALTSNYDYYDDSEIYNGDFNGDGYCDVLVESYNTNEKRQITIFSGTSSGTFNEGVNLSSVRNHKPYEFPSTYHVGDFNGDGYDDFINTYSDNGIRSIVAYYGTNVSPYVNDAPNDNIVAFYDYSISDYVFSGDVTGDGNDDLIVHYVNTQGKRCMRVYKGLSNGTLTIGENTTTNNSHNETTYPSSIYVSDIDSDGKCDMIVKWKNGNVCTIYTYKGNSDGKFNSTPVYKTTSTYFYLG